MNLPLQFSSVTQSCHSLWPHGLQHTRLPGPSLSPGGCSNSCPLSWWCHPTISSSVAHFSSCPQYFPASGSFPVSQLWASGGRSIRVSASVLPMNTQDWFPLGLTDLISLLSKGLSRVFSRITVWRHQFFSTQHFLWSNSELISPYQLSVSRCQVMGYCFFHVEQLLRPVSHLIMQLWWCSRVWARTLTLLHACRPPPPDLPWEPLHLVSGEFK